MDYGNAENEPKPKLNDWTLDWDYKLTVLYKCNTDNYCTNKMLCGIVDGCSCTATTTVLLARSSTTATQVTDTRDQTVDSKDLQAESDTNST